jgi:hypothetical protein
MRCLPLILREWVQIVVITAKWLSGLTYSAGKESKGGGCGLVRINVLGESANVTLVMDSSVCVSWRLHSWPCVLIGHLVLPWPLMRDVTDAVGGRWSKVSVRRTTNGNRHQLSQWNRCFLQNFLQKRFHCKFESKTKVPLSLQHILKCLPSYSTNLFISFVAGRTRYQGSRWRGKAAHGRGDEGILLFTCWRGKRTAYCFSSLKVGHFWETGENVLCFLPVSSQY